MKKYSLLTLVMFAVLLLSSCKPSEPSASDSPTRESKVETKTEAPKDSEPSSNAAGGSLSYCLDSCKIIKEDTGLISKETCQSGCYMNEAKEKKDPQVCTSNVSDGLLLSGCLTAVAEAMQDAKVCDKIGTDANDLMRGACYSTVAEKLKDNSICEGIKNSMMYSGCVGAASNE